MTELVVAVFGASRVDPDGAVYREGVRCGRLLAESGFAVATGGYGGLMEAVSRGARAAGGRVIGVTAPAVFPDRPRPNPHLTEERRAASLLERIRELTEGSAAALALPGSLGTATELMAAWNLAYVARFAGERPRPVVAVGRPWNRLVPELAAALHTDGTLVTLVATVDAAVAELVRRLQPEL
jgi:Predicted Rossmann fold nucleotide-binding protein